nr:MAG TPA: Regulatory peptide helical complex, MEMBRANE PROTEIN [Caudoviricetes sp.]
MMKRTPERLITALIWIVQILLFILLVILTSSLIEYVISVIFHTFFGGM